MIDQLALGQTQLEKGLARQAQTQFLAVLKEDASCPEALIGLGRALVHEGQYQAAESPLRQALKLQPNNLLALNALGNAAYRAGKYKEAIEFFQKALKHAGVDSYKLHVNLANALSDAGQVNAAISHFAQSTVIKPDYAPAYNGLAKMYYQNGKYDQAIDNALKAIHLKPDYAMAYYHLGVAQAGKGNFAEAKNALEQSLKYEDNPQYTLDTQRILISISHAIETKIETGKQSVIADIGRTTPTTNTNTPAVDRLLTQRKWQAAELAIASNLKNNEKDPLLWNNLGYALMHQDDSYARAKAAFERAIALSEGNFATAHYNLGQLLRLMNDNRGAERAFRQAIEDAKSEHKTYPLAQNALGLVLKQRNDYKGADAAFRRAIMQSGIDLPVAHYNLAILLEKTDNTREAVREYKAYLSLAPHGLNAQQAKIRLKRLGIDAAL